MADIARDVARIAGDIEVTHNWRITDPRPTHPANASVVRPTFPRRVSRGAGIWPYLQVSSRYLVETVVAFDPIVRALSSRGEVHDLD
jgi:hypothetical protein